MEYREAVQEARGLVKRSEEDQWRLAQLTWEQVEAGKSRRQWAKDIGVHSTTADRWYKMWARWGAGGGQRPDFADAYNIVRGRDEEAEEYGSHHAAKVAAGIRNLPPERKAKVAHELLQEPEVVRSMPTEHKAAIATDLASEPDVARHQNLVNREMQERARENYELREPRSVQIGANADMQYALTKARAAMADALEAADKLAAYGWPDESRRVAEVLVRRVSAGVELFMATLHGEDLDEELKALVEGGDL